MKPLKHWQDPINALLGVWVVLSPWALGFQDSRAATVNAVIIGLALVAGGLGAIFVPRAWEELTEGVFGLWLMASPWVLGFSMLRDAMLSAVVSGVVVLVLALWTLMTDRDYRHWMHHRTAH